MDREGDSLTTRLLVKDVMNSPAITANKNANVQELAKLMEEHRIGSIVITDEKGEAIGIVNDWDIVTKAATQKELPTNIKAKDIMNNLVKIESHESITKAARLFRMYGIKRLAVFYKNNLVGIISASDVISVMPELVDVISEKSNIIRGEIGRSEKFISGYCDECEEWSDYLQYTDGRFLCEDCRM
jgi:CBS domain-containing protein